MAAPIVKTETQHKGEFLVSEANGELSREAGIVASGQNLKDGQVVKLSSGKLVAATGAVDSSGNATEAIEGIMYGAINASASGSNADTPGVYIARLAEVKLSNVTLYTDSVTSPKTAASKAALLKKFIQVR